MFSPRTRNKTNMSALTLLFNSAWGFLANRRCYVKEIKGQIGKEEVKRSLFTEDMIVQKSSIPNVQFNKTHYTLSVVFVCANSD